MMRSILLLIVCLLSHHCFAINEEMVLKLLYPDVPSPFDYFEWEYVGQLTNGLHVVWSDAFHREEDIRYSAITVFQQEGSSLKILDECGQPVFTFLGGCTISGNEVFYSQVMAECQVLNEAIVHYPELEPYAEVILMGACCGSASHCAHFRYARAVSEAGQFNDEPRFVGIESVFGIFQRKNLKEIAIEKIKRTFEEILHELTNETPLSKNGNSHD